MIECIQIDNGKCVLIEEITHESMCPEFDPGPSDDDKYPEYYMTTVSVKLVNLIDNKISDLDHQGMKKLYKHVKMKNQRISYWRTMKYLKCCEDYKAEYDIMNYSNDHNVYSKLKK